MFRRANSESTEYMWGFGGDIEAAKFRLIATEAQARGNHKMPYHTHVVALKTLF